MTNEILNVFCKIFGRVQGVGFRAWTKKKAEERYLTGWVKNCKDNSVECEISGERKNIELFLQECNRGSLLSSVEKIHTEKMLFKKYKSFTIYY